jgi:GT2 family glycosyltransferase
MVSIIILTWNSEKYIKKCIESIYDHVKDPFEVIVVDNGSSDRTVSILKGYENSRDNFYNILLDKNYGTTYTRNIAVLKATGEYLLFLDSDVELTSDITPLIDDLKDENTGIVAPKLLYPDGSIQHNCTRFPTAVSKFLKLVVNKDIDMYEDSVYNSNKPLPVDYCMSAFLLVKKSLFKKIEGFDDMFFYAPEDVDFCLRSWGTGYKVIYDPRVMAVHYHQKAWKKNKLLKKEHITGLLKYFLKHKYFFTRYFLYRRLNKQK